MRRAKPPAISATSSPASGPWRSASSASARCTAPGRLLDDLAEGDERQRLGRQEEQRLDLTRELAHRPEPVIAMSPNGSAWASVTSPRRASSSAAISAIASSSGSRPAVRASKLTDRARASGALQARERGRQAHAAAGEMGERGRRRGRDQGQHRLPQPGGVLGRRGRRSGAGEGDPPVAGTGAVASALVQPRRGALEGRVGHEARGEALAGLERVGVGLLLAGLAQQAARLQLGHRGEQHDQLAGRVGVPPLARPLAERRRSPPRAAGPRGAPPRRGGPASAAGRTAPRRGPARSAAGVRLAGTSGCPEHSRAVRPHPGAEDAVQLNDASSPNWTSP